MTSVPLDEHGRPDGPFVGDEMDVLIGFLDYQRGTLAWKCSGLSDEQLRASLAPTDMTLGGMLLHLARVEDYWFSETVAEGGPQPRWAGLPGSAEWAAAATMTGEDLRAKWSAAIERSRAVVAAELSAHDDALAAAHPAWGGAADASMRWVLVHMVEEYARHNGHADLLRQSIDGETGE